MSEQLPLTLLNNLDVFVTVQRCRVCNTELIKTKEDADKALSEMSDHSNCSKFFRMAKELVAEYDDLYRSLSNRGMDDDDLVVGMQPLINLVKHGYWKA